MDLADPARDLFLGALALREGLIEPPALLAALGAWTADRSTTVAGLLLDRGDLALADLGRLQALVGLHAGDLGSTRADASAQGPTPPATPPPGASGAAHPDHPPHGHGPHFAGPARQARVHDRGDAPAQRFRILRHLAKGGIGSISVALDSELNREVALKQILPRQADDPTSRARFLLEAEITGGLEHPGIVPVYGMGFDSEGRPYYAMQLVRGGDLKDAIDSFHKDPSLQADPGARSLALRELLRRFGDACNAVDYAHGRGVFHRDIKPSNIAVGKHGETLVLDWGLAKATGRPDPTLGDGDGETALVPAVSGDPARTMAGSSLGTPPYMSPEAAAGRLDAVDRRSDVYSLGATLYCILAGRAPFDDPDVPAILAQVRAGQFPRPRELDPKVDPALEAICLKAMALKAAERYESAAALVGDLKRWAADEPVGAYPERRPRRLARWARRHSAPVAGVGALLLTATVALGLTAGIVAQARDELAAGNVKLVEATGRADASRNDAQANLRFATDAVDQLVAGIAKFDLPGIPEADGLRLKLAEEAAGFYNLLHDRDPMNPRLLQHLADAELDVAHIHANMGRFAEARERFETVRRLLGPEIESGSRQLLAIDSLILCEMYYGELIRDSGHKSSEAEEHLRRSVELAARMSQMAPNGGSALPESQANAALAGLLIEAREFRKAEPFARKAAERARDYDASLAGDDTRYRRLNLPLTLMPRARLLAKQGLPGAEQAGLEIVGMLRGLDPSAVNREDVRAVLAQGLDELAKVVAAETGRRPEALKMLEEAIQLSAALAERHPLMIFYFSRLAVYRVDRAVIRTVDGQLDGAREDLDLALPALRAEADRIPGRRSRENLVEAIVAFARLEAGAGRLPEARNRFLEAIDLLKNDPEAGTRPPADDEAIRRLQDELAALDRRP